MRTFCFVFLLLFAGAVGAFAYFNNDEITVRLFDWKVTAKLSVIAGVIYVAGMLSGGTVWGLLRRSASTVADTLDRRTMP